MPCPSPPKPISDPRNGCYLKTPALLGYSATAASVVSLAVSPFEFTAPSHGENWGSKPHGGANEQVAYLMSKGECAGARSFVDAMPRRTTLRAIGSATVYALEPDRFETLIDSHPRIVYKVMRAMYRITHANLLRMNQETQQLTDYVTKTHGRF